MITCKSLTRANPRWSAVMACLALGLFATSARAQLVIESFDGPVTQQEIGSFRTHVQSLTPATSNLGNAWSQGASGEQARAMGLVYEITGDTAILDQEIRYCDAVLSERNDLAPDPVGQHVIWTGGIDPVWPNNFSPGQGTGGEQGYVAGHLANCARHILETPSIWQAAVSIGDPYGFGTVYLDRAVTFVGGADAAVDLHILGSELDLSDRSRYRFSRANPYKGGKPVPWNQQMMFNYLFANLAAAHALLDDDPDRVARYDAIVHASLDWFFSSGVIRYTDAAGNPAYNWAYAPPATTGEDQVEGQWDVDGFYRLYVSGRYGLTAETMAPFANTFVDVMMLGPHDFAGRVDGSSGSGHAARTTTIRNGWLLLADLRPDAYEMMMAANLPAAGTTANISAFNRLLFVKNRRSLAAADWSVAVVESTMQRFTPSTIGGWSYTVGLYLHGQYLVHQRTGESRYLQYIQDWADRFVGPDGQINNSFSSLDSMMPGQVLLDLYQETGLARYKTAADRIRARLDTYPRTADGGFWHRTSLPGQLWLDGTFMVNPFLARYGALFGDNAYTDDETARQLLIYANHLQDPSGLLFHAYAENGASWADPVTLHSPEFWGRAIGWYGMAAIEVLESIAPDHPARPGLIAIVQSLVAALAQYQDPASGRWFQVVNRGDLAADWLETSCSAMYTYVISRAVQRGYVDAAYLETANRGYQGVLAVLAIGPDGFTDLTDISVGTNVGTLDYYLGRTRATNDFHGLGSFLIMNEQRQP